MSIRICSYIRMVVLTILFFGKGVSLLAQGNDPVLAGMMLYTMPTKGSIIQNSCIRQSAYKISF